MREQTITQMMQNAQINQTPNFLRSLGWSGSQAGIFQSPDSPEHYARLTLGSDTTSVGINLEHGPSNERLWWIGFQQGARYHFSIQPDGARWFDFEKRKEWHAKTPQEVIRGCETLSPSMVLKRGVFQPAADIFKSHQIPNHPPRQYLMKIIKGWWNNYFGQHLKPKQDSSLMKSRFVNLIARLIFIRTMEDKIPDGYDWLRPRELEAIANTSQPNQDLHRLFENLERHLGGQVFKIPRFRLPNHPNQTKSLLQSLYQHEESTLDFTALDFNMVGRFYEEVLSDDDQSQQSHSNERRTHGQYYTPRVFSDYLARRTVLPRVRLAEDVSQLPVIADIAVGSGELLTAALRYILSVPRFRNPKAIRTILSEKLVGLDSNPVAVQLTTLNLLRTAYLACPDLLDDEPALPQINHVENRNTLASRPYRRLPKADVLLTNPPFRGQPDWLDQLPKRRPKSLQVIRGNNDRATAFLLRGLELLKDTGTVGIVMPNQFFMSVGEERARVQISKSLAVSEVVNNRGAVIFDGVKVQPGLLIGRKKPNYWPTRTQVTTLQPPRSSNRDIVVTGLSRTPHALRFTVPRPVKSSDWIWSPEEFRRQTSQDLIPFSELIQDTPRSRCPMPGIGPLVQCWDLEKVDENKFRHPLSDDVYEFDPGDMAWIYKAIRPKLLKYSDVVLNPVFESTKYVLFPYFFDENDRLTAGTLDTWKQKAPTLVPLFETIIATAKSHRKESKPGQENFRANLAAGKLSYFRLSEYSPSKSFLLSSRMASLSKGSEQVRGWIFTKPTNLIPVSGNYISTSPQQSIVILSLLNSEQVWNQFRHVAPSRGPQNSELSSGIFDKILVPSHVASSVRISIQNLIDNERPIRMEDIKAIGNSIWCQAAIGEE